jgi:hypothetical protein
MKLALRNLQNGFPTLSIEANIEKVASRFAHFRNSKERQKFLKHSKGSLSENLSHTHIRNFDISRTQLQFS